MSVQAPELASDDGSGNEEHWRRWSAEIDGAEAYVVRDVGRASILAGRSAIEGLARDFQTDRIMPRRIVPPMLPRVAIQPIFIR